MKWLYIFLILFSLSANAIVGGVTSSDTLPSYLSQNDRQIMKSHTVVVLNSQNSSSHSRCTGTLIAKNVVLTAAHCIPQSLENFWIVTSEYEFAVMEQKPVTKVIVHEDYKSFDVPGLNKPNSDIALVQFAGDLPAGYAPTSFIDTFNPSVDHFWLYVAGYGVSSDRIFDAGELRFSRVTIENALFNANQSFMRGNQSMSEGICKGDSGGPAYIKIQDEFYVIGVVSAIVDGCTGTSYFNQTLFYNEWIKINLSTLL